MIGSLWTAVLTSGLLASALTAAGILIFRTTITEKIKASIGAEYNQRLETHKAQLKGQSDLAIEHLKFELSRANDEYKFRFSKLHEKRAEVIAEVYSRLKNLHRCMGDYVAVFEPVGMEPKEERRKKTISAFEEFDKYYQPNTIFLPKETDDALKEIRQKLVTAFNKFSWSVETSNASNAQAWLEIFESIKGPVAEALGDLEGDFRRLLGDGEGR